MAAQGVVRKGIRWQVGDGVNIRVWCDKWVPRPSTYMVVSPKKPSPQVALVKDLINRDALSGTWSWSNGTSMPRMLQLFWVYR